MKFVPQQLPHWLVALPIALALHAGVQAETVARYGISMADIPLTTGQPDRGAGAYQFTGHTIYDPLVAWEANIGTRPGKLVPGLASAWKADAKDPKKWLFTLRKGVKFHDGSELKASAVVWNLDKVLADKSPQYDAKQSAQVRSRIPSIASYRVVDDYTVEITTKVPPRFRSFPAHVRYSDNDPEPFPCRCSSSTTSATRCSTASEASNGPAMTVRRKARRSCM